MNEYSGEPIVREQKSYLKPLVVILVSLVAVVVCYQGYIRYQASLVPVVVRTPLESFGLGENINLSTTTIAGTLYYSSIATIEEGKVSSKISTLNTETEENWLTALVAMSNPVTINGVELLVLAPVTTGDSESLWQPQIFNTETEKLSLLPNKQGYHPKNLTISPDKTKYAYSFQSEDTGPLAAFEVSKRSIAIHTINSSDVVIIEQAHDLEWISDSEVLFVTYDGIQHQNLETTTRSLVFSGNYTFNAFDEIALSPDRSKIVITKPFDNLISLLSYSAEEVTEVGRIVTDTVLYSSPIFSPDSEQYVVVATGPATSAETELVQPQNSSAITLERRFVGNAQVVHTHPLTDTRLGSVQIGDWQ